MINFFGLNKILSKEKLWTTEKERLNVIKRVEIARSCNLPMHILDIIFPLGWKSFETCQFKNNFREKIESSYPLPQIDSSLQDMSVQEMRSYIEKLYNAIELQYDACIALLYNVSLGDKNFVEIKKTFTKRFLKASKLEIIIACFSIIGTIIIALGLFLLILKDSNFKLIEYLIFYFIVVIVLLFAIYLVFISRWFNFKDNKYLWFYNFSWGGKLQLFFYIKIAFIQYL